MWMDGDLPRDFLIVAINCIDIAMLDGSATEEDVRAMCERAKDPGEGLRPAAGVCVLPDMVEVAADALKDSPVRTVVATAGFPNGTLNVIRRQPEAKRALRLGADEIDTVLNWRALRDDNDAQAFEEIYAIKRWMRDKKLKVIIESGALEDPDLIRRATEVAILAGADFVKSSTGFVETGVTEEAARIMCEVIGKHHTDTGKMVGVKFSGGIEQPEQAVDLMSTVIGTLGFAFLSPHTFRLGSSKLFDTTLDALAADAASGASPDGGADTT
jgi:deoxyribose-phosphate aldolase